MFNQYSGFKVAVQTHVGVVPFICVPPDQISEVQQLLVAHKIRHTVGRAPCDRGEEEVIRLGDMWDVQRVQDILDGVV